MGLLIERRDYGYGLEKRLQERVYRRSALKTIYNHLNRLVLDALIEEVGEKEIGRTRRGHPRVMYAPTQAGLNAHREWMNAAELEDGGVLPPEELYVRLAVAGPQDFEILRGVVRREIKRCMQELNKLARPSLAAVTNEALPWSEAAPLLVGDARALSLQAHVQWLHTADDVLIHRIGRSDAG